MCNFKGETGFTCKFRNVAGAAINLKITNYENGTEYVIKKDFSNNLIRIKITVLFIIVLLNFLALTNESLNPLYSGCAFICGLIYLYRTVKTVQRGNFLQIVNQFSMPKDNF